MLNGLKQSWNEFRRGRPGNRFKARHERNRNARSGRAAWTRFLKPIAAILLLAAGVAFCLIPGPGVPLLFIGAGLLADVSVRVARALDWLELRIRETADRFVRWWKAAPAAAKSALVISTLILGSGAAYGVFRVFFAGVVTPYSGGIEPHPWISDIVQK
jgi:uncharacterized membrane protein SirB2